MSNDKIYTVEEAARKIGVNPEWLLTTVQEKLIVPVALADQEQEQYLFRETDLMQLRQIKNLQDIGYNQAEIKKIQRKIGFPKPSKAIAKQQAKKQYMTIGELADRTGLNARTIKYWEERGIIEPTARSEGGFRLYDAGCVHFCDLIHDLQLFGYSLEKIKEISDLLRFFEDLGPASLSGSFDQKIDQLNEMLEKIYAMSMKMAVLAKGIERWKKILKEKQAEIQTLKKQMAKEKGKRGSTTAKKAPATS